MTDGRTEEVAVGALRHMAHQLIAPETPLGSCSMTRSAVVGAGAQSLIDKLAAAGVRDASPEGR